MKKLISVLLAVLMVFSCFGAVTAAAADSDEESTTQSIFDSLSELVGIDFSNALNYPNLASLLPSDFTDESTDTTFEEMLSSGALNGVDFMGLNINYMYYSTDPIYWPSLSISRSDLALIYGNLNAYLLKMKKEKLNDYRFYTSEHATTICNFIGHLYDPAYTDIKITFDNNPTTSEIFYNTICERSGLTEWIDQQWIHNIKNTYYVALCTVLGMRLEDLPAPERDIQIATRVAPLLVKSIVEYKAQGPFAHIIEIIRTFTLTYGYYLSNAIIPFFQKYIDAGLVTQDELLTYKGLLNMLFNGNDKTRTDRLQFITPPSYRFAITTDEVENFLYLVFYCNLLGVYKSNPTAVNAFKTKINACPDYDATQKERLIAIIGMMFESKIAEVTPTLVNISTELITAVPNNVKDMLLGFVGRFLDGFYNILDKIYQAIRKFL